MALGRRGHAQPARMQGYPDDDGGEQEACVCVCVCFCFCF